MATQFTMGDIVDEEEFKLEPTPDKQSKPTCDDQELVKRLINERMKEIKQKIGSCKSAVKTSALKQTKKTSSPKVRMPKYVSMGASAGNKVKHAIKNISILDNQINHKRDTSKQKDLMVMSCSIRGAGKMDTQGQNTSSGSFIQIEKEQYNEMNEGT